MALGLNSSTQGRVVQTSPSIFAPSGTVLICFYTDMPPKVSQCCSILSCGLLSRRMPPFSTEIILQLMPLSKSSENKWETWDKRECSSPFPMNCFYIYLNSVFLRLAAFHKGKDAQEWSMIIGAICERTTTKMANLCNSPPKVSKVFILNTFIKFNIYHNVLVAWLNVWKCSSYHFRCICFQIVVVFVCDLKNICRVHP